MPEFHRAPVPGAGEAAEPSGELWDVLAGAVAGHPALAAGLAVFLAFAFLRGGRRRGGGGGGWFDSDGDGGGD